MIQPSYSVLAKYYDKFSAEDADYGAWADYLQSIALSCGADEIVDIACGTGKMSKMLEERGFSVIGLDSSAEMLSYARQKCRGMFVLQDMRKLQLTHKADMAVCVNDGVNYLKGSELENFFQRVSANLRSGAPFVFDISSPRKLKDIVGSKVFFVDEEDETLLWNNRCTDDRVTMELTLFVKSGNVYNRFDEGHVQYIHTPRQIEQALQNAGMKLKEISDSYGGKVTENSLRLTFWAVAR